MNRTDHVIGQFSVAFLQRVLVDSPTEQAVFAVVASHLGQTAQLILPVIAIDV